MTSGNKPEIVAGMDSSLKNGQKQETRVSRFREVLPQVGKRSTDLFAVCIALTRSVRINGVWN
jgi:hypothetical protein